MRPGLCGSLACGVIVSTLFPESTSAHLETNKYCLLFQQIVLSQNVNPNWMGQVKPQVGLTDILHSEMKPLNRLSDKHSNHILLSKRISVNSGK
ncbi:unnamed protein product [Tetraodon nigroviridis]|uniref:(spotted green pufferfish) hypothetical protein n=1 Tax=Tetraodon nigroviridis TaxID=99883 RepID=Q4RFK4_TETNG|nr:unnamed protein product [Tetraodon nigroviridis]